MAEKKENEKKETKDERKKEDEFHQYKKELRESELLSMVEKLREKKLTESEIKERIAKIKEKLEKLEKKGLIKEEKDKLLEISEISLWLDTYNDIFSSFDSRSYSQRALSDDFLIEAKKAARDKKGTIELRLLIPDKERNLEDEGVIRKRLHEHFRKHTLELKREKTKLTHQGIALFLIGIVMMFIATFLLYLNKQNLFFNFFIILLEPAGWFSFWEGLYLLLFRIKEKIPNLGFYEKMIRSEISFNSY